MAVHPFHTGRIMPWRRHDGSGGDETAPVAFTEAQLASLHGLEAVIFQSVGVVAAPRRTNPLIQLARELVAELEGTRAPRGESGRAAGRQVAGINDRRALHDASMEPRLGDLLRDVERRLTDLRAYQPDGPMPHGGTVRGRTQTSPFPSGAAFR